MDNLPKDAVKSLEWQFAQFEDGSRSEKTNPSWRFILKLCIPGQVSRMKSTMPGPILVLS
jgi:hypothetical protein